jgi:FixJ family two-component response regulator
VNNSDIFVAVVDDEEPVCRALRRLLCSAGFRVETFSSGAAFFERLPARRPDCLVLDLHMPQMSGFDVQARLTELGEQLPVVVITAHDTPQSRERAVTAGAAAYLRKPADDKALLEAVTTAVDRSRS